jgi:hypothetical protein
MQRIPFCGADLSDRDIEQLIERAKIARSGFLHDNARHVFRGIGWSALACGFAVLLILGASSTRQQVLDNTTVIERLATKLEPTERIKPGTVREVAQLLRRPDFDCRQIACDAWLEKRNLAARARLETILARHSSPATVAAKAP